MKLLLEIVTPDQFHSRPYCRYCNYRVQVIYYNGEEQDHCCTRCKETNGRAHSSYCSCQGGGDGNGWDKATRAKAEMAAQKAAAAQPKKMPRPLPTSASSSSQHSEARVRSRSRVCSAYEDNSWTHGTRLLHGNPGIASTQDDDVQIVPACTCAPMGLDHGRDQLPTHQDVSTYQLGQGLLDPPTFLAKAPSTE